MPLCQTRPHALALRRVAEAEQPAVLVLRIAVENLFPVAGRLFRAVRILEWAQKKGRAGVRGPFVLEVVERPRLFRHEDRAL